MEAFEIAGKIAGLAGLSIALCFYVFRDIIGAKIFPKLTKEQAYKVIKLIIIFTFSIAVIGIGSWLFISSLEQKNKLAKIREVSAFFKKLDLQSELKYKDTIIEMILVERNVRWNRSASGVGEYSFDDELGMIILSTEVINKGRQTHSFVITEQSRAKKEFFFENDSIRILNNFNQVNNSLTNIIGKENRNIEELKIIKTLNQKLYQNYQDYIKIINRSDATIKYSWNVSGDQNRIRRYPGRIIGGLKVTLRKYERPIYLSQSVELQNQLDKLSNI